MPAEAKAADAFGASGRRSTEAGDAKRISNDNPRAQSEQGTEDATGPSKRVNLGPDSPHIPWLRWRRIKVWGKRIFATVATVSTMLVAGWIAALIAEETLHRHSITLTAISVPKSLADAGFSSPVVTQRLRDTIRGWQERSKTTFRMSRTEIPKDFSNVTIPGAGVPVESVAASIRTLLPEGWRHEISGEFTAPKEGAVSLRLRLNERVILDTAPGPDAVDTLIERAARKVLDEVQPYIVASTLFETDIDASQAAAAEIIGSLAETDENAIRAHNLMGLISEKQGKPEDAIAEYRKAIRLGPKFVEPHGNLGNVWADQGKPAEAIAEYREAIRLGPKFALPHNGLGIVWADQGKPAEAIVEYREAIRLDPKVAGPHNNLGAVWADQGKPAEAIAEYREAIRLDPKLAGPHNNLGNVWADQGKPAEAIAEYREAIRLDPKYAQPHYGLGIVWSRQGEPEDASFSGITQQNLERLRAACREFAEGARLAPNDPDYKARMKDVDDALNGADHCLPSPGVASPEPRGR